MKTFRLARRDLCVVWMRKHCEMLSFLQRFENNRHGGEGELRHVVCVPFVELVQEETAHCIYAGDYRKGARVEDDRVDDVSALV